MEQALQITFRGMDRSTFIEARVHELTARFERFQDRITSCHVTIQSPHHHQQHGQLYDVRIRLGVTGGEIIVDHEGSQNHAHEDVYVALRDAFDAAVRKLEERAGRLEQRSRRRKSATA